MGAISALSLIGCETDRNQALKYLRSQCMLPNKTPAKLGQLYTEAKARLAAPASLLPDVRPLPPQYKSHTNEVAKTTYYQEACRGLSNPRFALVEIAPLVSLQLHVCVGAHTASNWTADQTLQIETCLAITTPVPSWVARNDGDDIVLESHDSNLVPLGWQDRPNPTTGESDLMGLLLGAGNPLVQVVSCGGRFYVRNGYHRIARLLESGNDYVPCLLLDTLNFGMIGMPPQFTSRTLGSPNPPTCANLHPSHALPVKIREVGTQVRISFKRKPWLVP